MFDTPAALRKKVAFHPGRDACCVSARTGFPDGVHRRESAEGKLRENGLSVVEDNDD